MKNILSADLYRLKKQKSTWVIPIVVFFVSFMMSCLNGLLVGNASWLQAMHETASNILGTLPGEGIVGDLSGIFAVEFDSVVEYVSVAFSKDAILALVIFVGLYCALPKKTGYLKNIALDHKPIEYFAVNTGILLVYSIIVTVSAMLGTLLTVPIFITGLPFGNAGKLLGFTMAISVLFWAGAVLVNYLCVKMKNVIIGIIIGCLYTGGLSQLFYSLINGILSTFITKNFQINDILPIGYSYIVQINSSKTWIHALILALVYVGLCCVFVAIGKKKDIR